MSQAALLTVDEAVTEIFSEFSTSNRKRLYALIKAGAIETIRINENRRYCIPRRAIKDLRGDDE